jgi:hypothetical protein
MHGTAESCPKYFLQRDKTSPLCYLVLPEMCCTGYCFTSRKQIQSLVEPVQGPTLSWCCQLAWEHQCYVSAGFPEVDLVTGKYYNSVLVAVSGAKSQGSMCSSVQESARSTSASLSKDIFV